MYKLLFDVLDFPGTIRAYRSGEFIHAAMLKKGSRHEEKLKGFLVEKGHDKDIVVKAIVPSVEDSFMALMNSSHSRPSHQLGGGRVREGDQSLTTQ